jgi:hypothetical protein
VLHLTFLTRGLWTWALIRASLAVAMLLLNGPPSAELPPFGRPIVLAVVLAAALSDVSRRREWVLIGNLGVTRATVALWCLVPAVLGEILLAMLFV